jgi:uncharacterized membrane protein YozB (DUF420 family)
VQRERLCGSSPPIRQTHLQLLVRHVALNAAALALDELTEVVVELDVEANHHLPWVTIADEAWAALRHPGLARRTSAYRNRV